MTQEVLHVTTDTAPELVGVRSRQISSRKKWKPLENIVAVDWEDGNLSEEIEVSEFSMGGNSPLYEISPEYVYFGSVKHVLKDMEEGADITFFNGDKIRETFSYEFVSPENELAMFRIATKEIPSDTLLRYRGGCHWQNENQKNAGL